MKSQKVGMHLQHWLPRFSSARYHPISLPARPFRYLHSKADFSVIDNGTDLPTEVDVEDLEGYVPGGYHPTLVGDTFCSGRYTVVHKLGFGGYSTISLSKVGYQSRQLQEKNVLAGTQTRILTCTTTEIYIDPCCGHLPNGSTGNCRR